MRRKSCEGIKGNSRCIVLVMRRSKYRCLCISYKYPANIQWVELYRTELKSPPGTPSRPLYVWKSLRVTIARFAAD